MYLIEFVHNEKSSCHYLHLQHYCHAHNIKANIFLDECVLLLFINDINFSINSPIQKSKYVVEFPFNRLFKNNFFSYIILEIIRLYHNNDMTEMLSYFLLLLTYQTPFNFTLGTSGGVFSFYELLLSVSTLSMIHYNSSIISELRLNA